MSNGLILTLVATLVIAVLLLLVAATEAAIHTIGLHRIRRILAGTPSEGGESGPPSREQPQVLNSMLVLRVGLLILLGGMVTVTAQGLGAAESVVMLSLVGTGLVIMFVEVAGRQIGILYSQAVARRVLRLMLGVARLLRPLVLLFLWATRPLGTPEQASAQLSVHLEDISDEIQHLQQQGVLEQEETQIIQSVFEFGETIAKEVMVPRVDMICVELGSPLDRVLELMIQCGYTRLPVYEENVDNILGLVNAKDLLKQVDELKQASITREMMREILFVPGTKKIAKVMRDLQRSKVSMAIVVDEYGGTDGLLTLEDIVEEIVGEITDEYDQASEGVQMLKDGSAIVDAKMVIEDVNSYLDLQLPFDEHETLGGYVFGLFGRVPRALESVEVDGLRLTVDSIQRQRITRVRIQRLDPGGSDNGDERPMVAASH